MLGAADLDLGSPPLPAAALPRRFLFLQGPLCPLFRRMGELLRAAGHEVHRVNLCAGDWLHWQGPGCRSYRGRIADWRAHVGALMDDLSITDLVLHGDRRVYHRIAVECAAARGIAVAATELGYLRPGWMTIERGGLSTLSHFPTDPGHIRRIAAAAGAIDLSPRYPTSFFLEAAPDVVYNLTNVALWFLYPHFRRHTIYHPVLEYLRAGWRLLGKARRDRRAGAQIAELFASAAPFFVLPLQLEGDFQLRAHSPFASFGEVIDLVLASFAAHAPNEARLVLKTHPLDAGVEGWPDRVRRTGEALGLDDRIVFLDGGSLRPLFERTAGVVTVNSTAGLEALQASRPVKTLVPAHFDIVGMTHQGDLDGFWRAPQPPDAGLVDAYVRAIAAAIQVRGSIHNREGLEAAARNMVTRLLERSLNEPDAFVDPPPRLARARAMGVPL
ncbi:capsule biosynthesis protein [Polymorphum gilvum]|uniref:Capsular polysaccharide biosynthesis/export protein n=1 Tax=Polymorphum gilvum (strain LMG 25793 / CGMCC 1.9160 / SL003B-26A1) TaxID=991905 RepID=F2J5V9_POLGS|nr:capsular biosynthesis protein [Polymorphum gilvum]ADZ71213.1 Capsular polysaccharide biosynthesis/export protein [Polymorphum gilvum SL003B-26A1]